MKVRHGFVSNSSSTSFCIFGASFDRDQIMKIFDVENVYNIDDKLKDSLLECHVGQEAESVYLGRSWDTIGDDQTGKEFKDSIQDEIEKKTGVKTACGTCEESWYDG